jgi:hypothetical protein
MELIRHLMLLILELNIQVKSKQIYTKLNTIAD